MSGNIHGSNGRRSVVSCVCAAIICVALVATPVVADINYDDIHSRIVRVEFKGAGKDRVASGFIWQRSDWVVTSLHTVLGDGQIRVQCKQTDVPATIISVHARADLALLKTDPFPDNCKPFSTVITAEPRNSQKLHTMGYRGAALAPTTRGLTKEWAAPPVTIARIVGNNDNVLNALRRLGTPDVDNLPIYYLQGGLLPGYSGAPIIDGNGNLVAVADGGLNGGTTDYNWAIPGKHLNELPAKGMSEMPSAGRDASGALFSSGITASDSNPIVNYNLEGRAFEWIKTKTVSLPEVLHYTDTLDLNSIRDLLYEHQSVFGANAENRLQFDVYEDIGNGLVIAVPVGQKLRYEDGWLFSNAPREGRNGSIQYQMIDWGIEISPPARPPAPIVDQSGQFTMPDRPSGLVMPGDADYFAATILDVLSDCNEQADTVCDLIEDSKEEYDYPGGNKVLNFAIEVQEGDYAPHYNHYSIAVRGQDNIAFQTYAEILWAPNDIYNCTEDPQLQGCHNSATAFSNLQQILAVSMSSTSRFYRPQPIMDFSAQ